MGEVFDSSQTEAPALPVPLVVCGPRRKLVMRRTTSGADSSRNAAAAEAAAAAAAREALELRLALSLSTADAAADPDAALIAQLDAADALAACCGPGSAPPGGAPASVRTRPPADAGAAPPPPPPASDHLARAASSPDGAPSGRDSPRSPVPASPLSRSRGAALAEAYATSHALDADDELGPDADGFVDLWGSFDDVERSSGPPPLPPLAAHAPPSPPASVPPLRCLLRAGAAAPDGSPREAVLLDRATDGAMRARDLDCASSLAASGISPLDVLGRARFLARYVSAVCGGAMSSDKAEAGWTAQRAAATAAVVRLGDVTVGAARHRALLFKALAPTCGVPCRLLRGAFYNAGDAAAACVVVLTHSRTREHAVTLVGPAAGAVAAASSPPADGPATPRSAAAARPPAPPTAALPRAGSSLRPGPATSDEAAPLSSSSSSSLVVREATDAFQPPWMHTKLRPVSSLPARGGAGAGLRGGSDDGAPPPSPRSAGNGPLAFVASPYLHGRSSYNLGEEDAPPPAVQPPRPQIWWN